MRNVKIPALIVAVPIVLVNIVSVLGQYAFLRDHLPTWGVIGAILFASALESTAVFIAAMAHAALMNGDSAARLRYSSLAFGAVIGLMNGSHYLHNGQVTFPSAALFLCSASSPVLWGIFSRRQSRDALISQGLIEGHAVRLGANRWLLHPVKSFGVFSQAVWLGEQNPSHAIAQWEDLRTVNLPQDESMTLETAQSKADAVRIAFRELGTDQTATALSAWLAERGHIVDPAYIRQLRGAYTRKQAQDRRKALHAVLGTKIAANGRSEQANYQ